MDIRNYGFNYFWYTYWIDNFYFMDSKVIKMTTERKATKFLQGGKAVMPNRVHFP